MADLSNDAGWRKSSFSGGEGGECLELHPAGAVRDSKNPGGSRLEVAWAQLVVAAKADRFTR